MVRLLVAVVLALLCPASAHAGLMPAPPTLTVHEGVPCPGVGGSCSDPESDQIWLSRFASRSDRAHEIGHQFDRQLLTDQHRRWFLSRLGFAPSHPWNNGTGEGCGSTCPDELFADAYAVCDQPRKRPQRSAGMLISSSETAYGYVPTRHHRRICRMIVTISRQR